MSDEVWDGSEGTEFIEETGDTGADTFIRVNGANVPITPGTSFQSAVKNAALNASLGKFRVFLNGNEIKSSQAPEIVQEGSRIELRPYDVAGI